MPYVIVSATRNKIVLSAKKEQFIYLKFNPKYSKVNAFNLALLASASYMDKDAIFDFLFPKMESGARDAGFTGTGNVSSAFLCDTDWAIEIIKSNFRFPEVPSMNTQFFHFETKEYVLMSFRGTQELFDIGIDLDAERVQFAEGAGKADYYFFGHSLGGALANLVAAYLHKLNYTKIMPYTFGCPRGRLRVQASLFKSTAYHFLQICSQPGFG